MKNIGNINNKNIGALLNSSNIYYEGGGKTLNNIIYPVGAVIIRVDSVNPSTWYGGTWELLCPGRTLVCIDTGDGDFNTVKKIGGNKNLQSHSHSAWLNNSGGHQHLMWFGGGANSGTGGQIPVANQRWGQDTAGMSTGDHDHGGISVASTGSGNSQNLQPYMVVYIWVRTA